MLADYLDSLPPARDQNRTIGVHGNRGSARLEVAPSWQGGCAAIAQGPLSRPPCVAGQPIRPAPAGRQGPDRGGVASRRWPAPPAPLTGQCRRARPSMPRCADDGGRDARRAVRRAVTQGSRLSHARGRWWSESVADQQQQQRGQQDRAADAHGQGTRARVSIRKSCESTPSSRHGRS